MKKLLVAILLLAACRVKHADYLRLVEDSASGKYAYVNSRNDTVIPPGKYLACYTDTFRNFAVVINHQHEMVAINRQEKILFKPFIFDNGPDFLSEGLMRITENGKIGYADTNGRIIIQPQFGCAFPFEHGYAKVSNSCKTIATNTEHKVWQSNDWFYINKTGQHIKP